MSDAPTAKMVLNRAVGRFPDPDSDLLILALETAEGEHLFALDPTMALLVIEGLAGTAAKLTAPRHVN